MITDIVLSLIILVLIAEKFISLRIWSRKESKYLNALLSKDAHEFAILEKTVDNKESKEQEKEESEEPEFASISEMDEEAFDKMIKDQINR